MTEGAIEAVRRLIWDYRMTPEEFITLLDGEIKPGGFDRIWAMRRAAEGLNYYDLLEIVGLQRLARDWPILKPTLRSQTRAKGIDYVLRKHHLSAPR
ncbi:MAG: hypothetical protein JW843_01670 [Candidatus Aminicenantes bacterium]|nr:hypothetical protein [Candidatus Aminicenantes bacterium]